MARQNRKRNTKRQSDWARQEADIRALVRADRFTLTSHVFDKIANNCWEFDDVIQSLLTGAIQRAEKDDFGTAIDGKKYVILGSDCYGNSLETVGKIVRGDDGREYLVITVY